MGNCNSGSYTQIQHEQQDELDLINHEEFKSNKKFIDIGINGNIQKELKGIKSIDDENASESENDDIEDDEHIQQELILDKSTMWDKIVGIVDKTYYNEMKKDEMFLPQITSITFDVKSFPIANDLIWLRSKEFSQGNEMKVFEGQIEPNDIKQGSLGDCYFLSSLSALAEKQNLISRLFETKYYNDQGLYCIWLCSGGQWEQVVIDDYFPCFKDTRQPAFSLGNGPELWVLLLEKAYAKIHGCYSNIEAGLTGDAIRDLTGAPYDYKNSGEEGPDAVWEFLVNNNNYDRFICTAGSNQDVRGTEMKQSTGIISGHAYAILDTKVVYDARGNQARIIQLRNPWGSNEWQGDWSDKSHKWTAEAKKKCNWKDSDDGIFWMPVEDFCKSYSDITISYVHEDFYYSSHKVQTQGQKYFLAKFKVDRPETLAYISLCQKNKRCFYGSEHDDYSYSMASLMVFRVQETGSLMKVTSFYDDQYGNSRDIWVKHKFKRGDYIAMCHIEWNQDYHNDIVLSAYSQIPVRFDERSQRFLNKLQYECILDECILLKKPKPNFINTYGNDVEKVFKIKGKIGGYVYYYYMNGSEDIVLNEKCFVKNRKGVTICYPHRDSDQFEVKVQPNDKIIVKFSIDSDAQGAYSYSMSLATSYKRNKWNW